jgi:hypothetical protein
MSQSQTIMDNDSKIVDKTVSLEMVVIDNENYYTLFDPFYFLKKYK